MQADYFAYKQYLDYLVYKQLAERETNPEFKAVLLRLVQHELEDYKFWRKFTKADPRVTKFAIWKFKFIRRILGLTFMARFLEGRERGMTKKYTAYLATVQDAEQRAQIEEIIRHERFHESQFIAQVKEGKVEFLSSIILGLNDGLIEITGALVGFSLALQQHLLVALTGLIVGISASLSMAASAYLQAKHEPGKDPKKAALYTGISYLGVVALLIGPYFLLTNIFAAIAVMLVLVLFIVALVSWYSATLYDQNFLKAFLEIATFSLGVSVITFVIGLLFRQISGVTI